MNERTILKAQIETLDQQLRRAQVALNSQQLPAELRSRVKYLFENLIGKQLQELSDAGSEVEHDLPLKGCWLRFRKIRECCTPILEECLALIEGALVRSAGLDEGLCQIADALLDDLSIRANISWGRFTILAEKEFFGEMAQIIRLRFPGISIWNLPIAAHEFGHFVGPELRQRGPAGTFRYPFQDDLEAAIRQSSEEWYFLHEHFADVFATYALGPAFAYTCIILRFDPMTAFKDTPEHPGYAKRFYIIYKTLEKMKLGAYMGKIDTLYEMWQQSWQYAKPVGQLKQEMTQPLDELLDKLYDLIDTELNSIKYKNPTRASGLSQTLEIEKDPKRIVEFEQYTLSDVLNAAWMYRSELKDGDSDEVSRIGTKAIKVCKEIISHRELRKNQSRTEVDC